MKYINVFIKTGAAFFVTASLLFGQFAFAVDAPVKVNVDNFVRAETAAHFDWAKASFNKWYHVRQPSPLDQQNVIRQNRDTLYSLALVDISKGATITIPETGDRYLSVMVLNEDHYINKIYRDAGTHELTMKEFHTPYVYLNARILVNSADLLTLKQ